MPPMHSAPALPDLSHWRAEFPVFQQAIHLNSCSLGALSRRARARQATFLEQWDARGAANWYDVWWEALDELRARYARLVGAGPDEIALHPSVSSILASVGSAIGTAARPRIVTTRLDFPTVPYRWLAAGSEVVLLESPDGISVPLDAFEQAVDERTALVVTSHVYFTSGAIQDVAGVAAIARRRGALTLIDGYQGAGQLPVDVKAMGVDFYCSGGLKWLLGGPGICFLFADRNTTAELQPSIVGWFGHEQQFAFDPGQFVPHADARRFETGTPALPSVHLQLGGLEVLEAIGAAAIRAVSAALTEDLIAAAQARGLHPRVAPRAAERSAIVMLPSADPHADVARLAAKGIVVDARPGHVRVSPYFYNIPDDHHALLEILGNG